MHGDYDCYDWQPIRRQIYVPQQLFKSQEDRYSCLKIWGKTRKRQFGFAQSPARAQKSEIPQRQQPGMRLSLNCASLLVIYSIIYGYGYIRGRKGGERRNHFKRLIFRLV